MASKEGSTTAMCTSLVFLLILQGAASLFTPVKEVIVPPHPVRHSNVTLECHYEIVNAELYALKWYHDELEIYRYSPKEDPRILINPNDKVEVIESETSPEKITLKEVDLTAAGTYTCEVNSDWPDFKSHTMSRNMTVVVIPEEQPNIEGEVNAHYAVGDMVNLKCIAAPSIPAAALVWLINDREADEEYLTHYEKQKYADGLLVSSLGLSFQLEKKDFINGELKLKCTATIAALYRSSDEHSQQDTAIATEVRERPTEGSLVKTGSASQNVLGLPVLAALVLANLLW
ncbi:cell adhesion molecule 2-like [Palaemon carinicauda]|uniref:cell adhesion molecule 2-like n=1 Tax=Palaemon carinicauda TaxID=392227 RepID=UPI0035B61E20